MRWMTITHVALVDLIGTSETIAEKKMKTMKKICEVILLSVGSCEGYQVGDSGVTV